jgi:hypothetical protein
LPWSEGVLEVEPAPRRDRPFQGTVPSPQA